VAGNGVTVDRRYLDALGVRQWVRRDWQPPLSESVPVAESVRAVPMPPMPDPVVTAVAETAGAAAPLAEQVAKPDPDQAPPPVDPAAGPLPSGMSAQPLLPSSPARVDWQTLQASVADCCQCELHRSRTQTVFGVGDPQADWMLIGEAPGVDEDRLGEPFVGRSGKLLDQMLHAVGFSREQVYIANTLKCRPPNNRDPLVAESACCRPWLERQIELIQPKVIMAVGGVAAKNLLNTRETTGALRGRVHQYGAIPLVVGYHPAYLLRSPSQKRKAWQDLLLVKRVLDSVP